MKKNWITILGWTVFLVIAFAAVWMMSHEEFDQVRAIEGSGTYLLHEQQLIPKENVDIFLAGEGKLFVFFEENELVNVYASDGSFLYGIQFPDFANGKSDMAFREGKLYVDARGSGRYVFQGTKLLQFEDQSIYNDTYHELDACFQNEYPHTDGEYTYTYVKAENKFVRSANDQSRDVLQFPKRNKIIIPLLVLDLAVLGAIAYVQEKKNQNNR